MSRNTFDTLYLYLFKFVFDKYIKINLTVFTKPTGLVGGGDTRL